MGLSVTVLGSSGTYAGPGASCSGYLVRSGPSSIWVDCGSGTLAALQEHVAVDAVDAVIVSHSHPDHWLDLPVFRNACKYVFGRADVPVYAPAEVRRFADAVLGDTASTFRWNEIADGDVVAVAGLSARFSRTDHPVETLAVRFESEGRSLAYSADTGPGWSMAAFGAPVDLAVWEATFTGPTPARSPHTGAADTGKLAAEAGVGRLVLTHQLPGTDPAQVRAEAATRFGGPVELANARATFEA